VDLGGALYQVTALPPPDVDLTGAWDTVSYTCRPTSLGPKCTVQGTFLLQNHGTQSSPRRALTKFYLSQDGVLGSDDVELRKQWTGQLAAGRTVRLSFRKNLPIGDVVLDQFVIAVVDAENAIAETEENNNIIAFGPIH
jgi:subtilase family serine protease